MIVVCVFMNLGYVRLQKLHSVEMIGENMQYEKRRELWKNILQSDAENTENMLVSLKELSEKYQEMAKMADKFIDKYGR